MSRISRPREGEDFHKLAACPLCGGATFQPILDRRVRAVPVRFVRCSGCSLVFQNPRLTEAAASRYFNSDTFLNDGRQNAARLGSLLGYEDYSLAEAGIRRTSRYRLRLLAPYAPPPARLLEVGSATGVFLDEARLRGYEVRGLDISGRLAQEATKNYGLQVDVGPVETFPVPEGVYDVVCCWGGIPCWRDFLDGLTSVKKALKPGGVLALNHSNLSSLLARFLGSRYFEFNPGVFTVFSQRSMDLALRKAGFSPILVRTDFQFAALGWILTYLRSSRGLRAARSLGIERLVLPVLALTSVFRICRTRETAPAGTQRLLRAPDASRAHP